MSTPHASFEPLAGEELTVSITATDLEKSISWYCDVLGFRVTQRYEREGKPVAASMAAGSVHILLGQDDGAKGWDRPKGQGFSLQITTKQAIDALARRAVDAGAALDTPVTTTPWGVTIFRVRDPDGFLFTISSPRPAT